MGNFFGLKCYLFSSVTVYVCILKGKSLYKILRRKPKYEGEIKSPSQKKKKKFLKVLQRLLLVKETQLEEINFNIAVTEYLLSNLAEKEGLHGLYDSYRELG